MTSPAAPVRFNDASDEPELSAGAVSFLLHYVRRHLRLSLALLILVTSGALCAVAAQYGLGSCWVPGW
jgi:hypothetical protein